MAKFEVFQDKAKKWRWRLKAGNGQIVATSGESFSSRSNAVSAATTVKRLAPEATLPTAKLTLYGITKKPGK